MLGRPRFSRWSSHMLRRHRPFWFCARACEGRDEEGLQKDAATLGRAPPSCVFGHPILQTRNIIPQELFTACVRDKIIINNNHHTVISSTAALIAACAPRWKITSNPLLRRKSLLLAFSRFRHHEARSVVVRILPARRRLPSCAYELACTCCLAIDHNLREEWSMHCFRPS